MSDPPKAVIVDPECPSCGGHLFEEFNVATVLWPVLKIIVPINPKRPVAVFTYGTAEPLIDSSSTDGVRHPYRCCDCENQFELSQIAGPRIKPEILPFTNS